MGRGACPGLALRVESSGRGAGGWLEVMTIARALHVSPRLYGARPAMKLELITAMSSPPCLEKLHDTIAMSLEEPNARAVRTALPPQPKELT